MEDEQVKVEVKQEEDEDDAVVPAVPVGEALAPAVEGGQAVAPVEEGEDVEDSEAPVVEGEDVEDSEAPVVEGGPVALVDLSSDSGEEERDEAVTPVVPALVSAVTPV